MTFLCFNVEMIFRFLNLLVGLVETYVGYVHFLFSLYREFNSKRKLILVDVRFSPTKTYDT